MKSKWYYIRKYGGFGLVCLVFVLSLYDEYVLGLEGASLGMCGLFSLLLIPATFLLSIPVTFLVKKFFSFKLQPEHYAWLVGGVMAAVYFGLRYFWPMLAVRSLP